MGGVLGQGSIPRPHGPAVFGPLGLLCSLPGSSCCTSPFSGKNGEKNHPEEEQRGQDTAGTKRSCGQKEKSRGRLDRRELRDRRGAELDRRQVALRDKAGQPRDNRDTGRTAG